MNHFPFKSLLLLFAFLSNAAFAKATEGLLNTCSEEGVWVQVLGSGGPEINDQRASSSYLVWMDGQARVLVDAGSGSSLNFERSGALYSVAT